MHSICCGKLTGASRGLYSLVRFGTGCRRVSIGNFGAGFACPAQRRSITADTEKVAAGFGPAVVAEDIETEEQIEGADTVGARLLDAYLFSKPIARLHGTREPDLSNQGHSDVPALVRGLQLKHQQATYLHYLRGILSATLPTM